jgi:hypothetical protein
MDGAATVEIIRQQTAARDKTTTHRPDVLQKKRYLYKLEEERKKALQHSKVLLRPKLRFRVVRRVICLADYEIGEG